VTQPSPRMGRLSLRPRMGSRKSLGRARWCAQVVRGWRVASVFACALVVRPCRSVLACVFVVRSGMPLPHFRLLHFRLFSPLPLSHVRLHARTLSPLRLSTLSAFLSPSSGL